MKEIVDQYKSNFPIILLLIYAFGYTYLNRYYSNFDINFENYISLTDILFLTINTLIKFVIIYLVIEVILILSTQVLLDFIFRITHSKKRKGSEDQEVYYEKNIVPEIEKNEDGTSLFLFFLFSGVSLYIFKEYVLIATIFFPFFIIKLYNLNAKNEKDKNEKKEMFKFFFYMFIPVLIVCFGIWGHYDAKEIKEGTDLNLTTLELEIDNIKYSTEDVNLSYIGETTPYLFIYDKKNRKTLVFNKQNIDKLKIFDPDIKSEKPKKQFIE